MTTTDNFDNIVVIRPSFTQDCAHTSDQIVEVFENHLKHESSNCSGSIHPPYIVLYPLLEDQHYWSPQLSILIEDEQTYRTLHGRYGPKPSVWTMFVFFYAVIGLAAIIISVIGMANMSLDESTTILYLLPLLLALFLSLFFVASTGKKKGHDQMVSLQNSFKEAMSQLQ